MHQRIHSEIIFRKPHTKIDTYTVIDIDLKQKQTPVSVIKSQTYSAFTSVYPAIFETKIESLLQEYFIQSHLEDFQKFLKKAAPIYPLLVLAEKKPTWITLDIKPLLDTEIQNKSERSLFVYGILNKFTKDTEITKHTKIKITAGKVNEDIDENYLTVIINIDGTPQSIEAYKKILSEFYKYPQELNNIMIFFKVTPQE